MIRDRGLVLLGASVLLPALALVCTARLAGGPGDTTDVDVPAALAPVSASPPIPSAAPVSRNVLWSRSGQRLPQVSPAWVAGTAAENDIPAPAVSAYGRAVLVLDAEDPSCHLGWTTLAGIGAVESNHGQIGGRTLAPDGRSSTPVVGPALDGVGFAAVPATAASVRWHGDPHWDHAIGALQFLPSTWHRWAADGDGDGLRDPNDINDAALAAARYLCAGDRDLVSSRGWYSAVLSYNHAGSYVDQVRRAAMQYR